MRISIEGVCWGCVPLLLFNATGLDMNDVSRERTVCGRCEFFMSLLCVVVTIDGVCDAMHD